MIELTNKHTGNKVLINISAIVMISKDSTVYFKNGLTKEVSESFEEIKKLLKI